MPILKSMSQGSARTANLLSTLAQSQTFPVTVIDALPGVFACITAILIVWYCLFGRSQHRAWKDEYWLTRIVLLRGMGAIYLSAFLTAAFQCSAFASLAHIRDAF
eukprot:c20686_g1_i3.p2 GENE.c20686_g1_i3~~c20686_g1_i3.p2  ORF type:complete len:105 (+),score=15.81 c20686_g1_i3:167-481(+)